VPAKAGRADGYKNKIREYIQRAEQETERKKYDLTGRKYDMKKQINTMIATILCCIMALMGCDNVKDANMEMVQTDISTITVPDHVQVVGLGEASHGVKEYQKMKAEVFQALVQNNGCRTFIIEGDFGSALKVDDYIHGKGGAVKEAAAGIGYRIYCTKEMEELLDWMRVYNETAKDGEDLHFYGMDMQWADDSKDYLFQVLDQAAPDLSEKYKEIFAFLNDNDMFDIDEDAFLQGMTDATELLKEIDGMQESIERICGKENFEFARECAYHLYACCDIRKSDMNYNAVRDNYMAEKVQWFIEHGDGSVIFINGHNGHIGKTSIAAYDCLGKILSDKLGEDYFAIGTDAKITVFNSQNEDGFDVKTVENENEINTLVSKIDKDCYYIDFDKISEDDRWREILSGRQRITTLNVSVPVTASAFCTSEIILENTFDGMIVFDEVSPTTLDFGE